MKIMLHFYDKIQSPQTVYLKQLKGIFSFFAVKRRLIEDNVNRFAVFKLNYLF